MKTKLYERGSKCSLHNKWGSWYVRIYRNKITGKTHLALESAKTDLKKRVLIRIHSSCLFGDVLHDKACDCREQLEIALKEIGKKGGIVFYLDQEGRGIGLWNKTGAYALKERGFDTVEANEYLGLPAENRDFSVVSEILQSMGITQVEMLTNNTNKINSIKKAGISVNRTPCYGKTNGFNKKYLYNKTKKMSHL